MTRTATAAKPSFPRANGALLCATGKLLRQPTVASVGGNSGLNKRCLRVITVE